MEVSLRRIKNAPQLGAMYVGAFLVSFHLFLVIYVNSNFLTSFPSITEKVVGNIYIIGSLFGIFSMLFVSSILRRIGNYRFLVGLTFFHIATFLGFAFITHPPTILILFIAYLVSYPLIFYSFDIFAEMLTKEESRTGGVRGLLLTSVNGALIIAPLIAGFIVGDGNYWKVYTVASLVLIPFLFTIRRFKNFIDPVYNRADIRGTFLRILKNKDLYNIMWTQFLMRFFFSWMVIYMPIYLIQEIGFSWAEFGLITFIYLFPFALFEYPAGKLADSRLGEKEFLALGFFIGGLFTIMMSFVAHSNLIYWALLLFMTRTGLALVEIMSDTYFFKHVTAGDNNIISFFRMTRPIAYIAGPIIATLALSALDFQYIWIVLGTISFFGIWFSLRIQDTR